MTKPDNSLLPIDWERIEADYRAGILSVREIAKRAGCTHTAINLKAKERGWARDLRAKIKAKTDELLSKRALSIQLSTAAAASEGAIITANAEDVVTVELVHQEVSRRSLTLMRAQLLEVEQLQGNPELFAQVADALSDPDERTPELLRQFVEQATSLPKRQRAAREAVEGVRSAVLFQRFVLRLDDGQPAASDPSSFENLVDLATASIAASKQPDRSELSKEPVRLMHASFGRTAVRSGS